MLDSSKCVRIVYEKEIIKEKTWSSEQMIFMTQDERWKKSYYEVMTFVETDWE